MRACGHTAIGGKGAGSWMGVGQRNLGDCGDTELHVCDSRFSFFLSLKPLLLYLGS